MDFRESEVVSDSTASHGDTTTFCVREYLVRCGGDAGGQIWVPKHVAVLAERPMQEWSELAEKEPGCKFEHVKGICRCKRHLIISGQDESIFKSFQRSSCVHPTPTRPDSTRPDPIPRLPPA